MNNKFGDCCNCPALVDGRFFTRYDDRIELDLEIMKKNNITDSHALRKYLIENGANMIDSNIKNIEKNYKCTYDKPRDATVAPIDSSYYLGAVFNDPSLTLAPFDSLSNSLIQNPKPIGGNNNVSPSPALPPSIFKF